MSITRIVSPVLIVLSFLPVGCANDGGGESEIAESPSGDLHAAVEDYNSGRYPDAHAKSLAAMRDAAEDGDATSRDHAAYVAGLSAYRMRQFDEAETRLLSASHSGDAHVQGRSKALLGLIRVEQNRPAAAADYFRDASGLLEGDDAVEARYQASIAFEQAGNPAAASAVPQSPGATTAGTGTGLFAIQVGAFESLANAQTAAGEARNLASREGLGEVRIIPRRDSRSRTLYVVQFGSFSSRTAAESARREIGRLNYIVAPLSRG